ncbi:CueP family metal-binding protein [Demequina litorisediminis]|uniref:Uncharacterized protein n=1 Tax=Demequina litorisediminis TaxID=1849022 RepID=A0ABQ6I9J9_9MICO|nr:CueP family metal-binding protein [Demequina litorisediminis]GMA34464.1 hypothetical protein GCM10025876_06680 [Demequina litorisediminis]
MPDDAFYVSLAPYVDTTHECYFHSLTTCTGEMQGEDIDVTVTDVETGEVLVDEAMTTFDNGFVGLWLPRDAEARRHHQPGRAERHRAVVDRRRRRRHLRDHHATGVGPRPPGSASVARATVLAWTSTSSILPTGPCLARSR